MVIARELNAEVLTINCEDSLFPIKWTQRLDCSLLVHFFVEHYGPSLVFHVNACVRDFKGPIDLATTRETEDHLNSPLARFHPRHPPLLFRRISVRDHKGLQRRI